jgi:hypothetical protein
MKNERDRLKAKGRRLKGKEMKKGRIGSRPKAKGSREGGNEE